MNEIKKTPIIILNGFLGSGKTTLFLNLLAQSKKKNIPVCAIVNDMSELDVDGELIGNTELVESNRNILESINSISGLFPPLALIAICSPNKVPTPIPDPL